MYSNLVYFIAELDMWLMRYKYLNQKVVLLASVPSLPTPHCTAPIEVQTQLSVVGNTRGRQLLLNGWKIYLAIEGVYGRCYRRSIGNAPDAVQTLRALRAEYYGGLLWGGAGDVTGAVQGCSERSTGTAGALPVGDHPMYCTIR